MGQQEERHLLSLQLIWNILTNSLSAANLIYGHKIKKKIGRIRVYETYPLFLIAIYYDGMMFIICAYDHILCIRLDDLFELYFTNIKPKWGDRSIPRLHDIYLIRMAMDGIWTWSRLQGAFTCQPAQVNPVHNRNPGSITPCLASHTTNTVGEKKLTGNNILYVISGNNILILITY